MTLLRPIAQARERLSSSWVRRKVARLIPDKFRTRIRHWHRLRVMLRKLQPDLQPARGLPHDLPGELIVSLTSFPARFGTLHLTVRSLVNQDVAADRVILWLAEGDLDQLPFRVKRLRRKGLDIRPVPDLRSYKKLVFALDAFPNAYIVTADDDVFYPPHWLGNLVSGAHEGTDILCHRAHRIPGHDDVGLPPYAEWEWDVADEAARRPSRDLVPTGVGGVLYPPGALHRDVTDERSFRELAPTADDLWFYWMARRAGTTHRKVGPVFDQLIWPGSQAESLYALNVVDPEAANDVQARNLFRSYGDPTALPASSDCAGIKRS